MIWYIRILHGPDTGKVFPLHEGVHFLGRSADCSISVHDQGVSKKHAQIEVYSNKVIISDLKSRNGTFINGTKITTAVLQPGARASVHDTFFEVLQMPESWGRQFAAYPQTSAAGNLALNMAQPQSHSMESPIPSAAPNGSQALLLQAHYYLNEVLVPGILKFTSSMEFRWAIALFVVLYAMLITGVSTIPFIRVLKSSAEYQSEQHALTIATVLAKTNRAAIAQGMDSGLSVDIALRRPGVKKAFIINSSDGNVLAPSNAVGTYPDLPYIHEARKLSAETVKIVDDATVVAAVPIDFFNAETGNNVITAHAVVFYDMSAQLTEGGRLISLFMTTLLFALFIGLIIYFFLMKVIEQPLYQLNTQLDTALKEGQKHIELNFQYPILQKITDNLNSALSRVQNNSGPAIVAYDVDRAQECLQLVSLCGFPALGIMLHDQSVGAINEEFEKITGVSSQQMLHQPYTNIHDQALRLSMKDLLERIVANPSEIITNDLEFGGASYQLVVKAIGGNSGPSYCILLLFVRGGEA